MLITMNPMRVVVCDHQLLTMDEHEIMSQARQHANALYKRAGIDIKLKWPLL
jgi:hypothetical protein